jgi:glycerophosphoryl diester phosphodiesterase
LSERPFSQGPQREDWRPPLVVAHRGASATHAENTIGAFIAAMEAGADAVEFDVRSTADGHPVVMHDALVDRTTDGHGPIRSMTSAEVERLRVRGDGADDLRVPSLDQTLAALSGHVGVVMEIKNVPGEPDFDPVDQRVVEATLASLHRTAFVGPVLVVGFNPMSIDASRKLEPGVTTGLLAAPGVGPAAAFAYAREHGHRWILPHADELEDSPADLVEQIHAASVRIGTWVVDDPAVAIGLMRAGVDAVATNDPASLVDATRIAFGR